MCETNMQYLGNDVWIINKRFANNYEGIRVFHRRFICQYMYILLISRFFKYKTVDLRQWPIN